MATTYSQRKVALDEIADRIQQAAKRMQQGRASYQTAETDLAAMQTAYSEIVSDINADASANPLDQAHQLQKAEKDKLVADFQSLKSTATAVLAAIDGV